MAYKTREVLLEEIADLKRALENCIAELKGTRDALERSEDLREELSKKYLMEMDQKNKEIEHIKDCLEWTRGIVEVHASAPKEHHIYGWDKSE